MAHRIYFAAPLFNGTERKFNQIFKDKIVKDLGTGFDIYFPQENAGNYQQLLSKKNMSDEDVRIFLYRSDVTQLKECDLMVANITGRVPDEGVAYEMGYFAALGKPIIVFSDDDRCFEKNHINLMLEYYPNEFIAASMEEAIKFIGLIYNIRGKPNDLA